MNVHRKWPGTALSLVLKGDEAAARRLVPRARVGIGHLFDTMREGQSFRQMTLRGQDGSWMKLSAWRTAQGEKALAQIYAVAGIVGDLEAIILFSYYEQKNKNQFNITLDCEVSQWPFDFGDRYWIGYTDDPDQKSVVAWQSGGTQIFVNNQKAVTTEHPVYSAALIKVGNQYRLVWVSVEPGEFVWYENYYDEIYSESRMTLYCRIDGAEVSIAEGTFEESHDGGTIYVVWAMGFANEFIHPAYTLTFSQDGTKLVFCGHFCTDMRRDFGINTHPGCVYEVTLPDGGIPYEKDAPIYNLDWTELVKKQTGYFDFFEPEYDGTIWGAYYVDNVLTTIEHTNKTPLWASAEQIEFIHETGDSRWEGHIVFSPKDNVGRRFFIVGPRVVISRPEGQVATVVVETNEYSIYFDGVLFASFTADMDWNYQIMPVSPYICWDNTNFWYSGGKVFATITSIVEPVRVVALSMLTRYPGVQGCTTSDEKFFLFVDGKQVVSDKIKTPDQLFASPLYFDREPCRLVPGITEVP